MIRRKKFNKSIDEEIKKKTKMILKKQLLS